MKCLKLLGHRLMVRNFNDRVAEVRVPVAVLNRFKMLSTPVILAMCQMRPGKGEMRLTFHLCNGFIEIP
ncbi:hypothetical protein P775_11305 [Puniceibacterium antarcticum]|uniref:Transposase DDE domain-containing protein n=1 Tax=Puniceibacterium antarcticum TaxID=1206336 RepID=A0A2G8REW1_9RHOB|nr:hypothetical protein P775_11305 [Puniceibacterium antarcticum]